MCEKIKCFDFIDGYVYVGFSNGECFKMNVSAFCDMLEDFVDWDYIRSICRLEKIAKQ